MLQKARLGPINWLEMSRFGALIASLGRHQQWEGALEMMAELMSRRLETNVILCA